MGMDSLLGFLFSQGQLSLEESRDNLPKRDYYSGFSESTRHLIGSKV
jgi:hypothetical protein